MMQLCAGLPAERAEALGLSGGAASFRYLCAGRQTQINGVDDGEEFRNTMGVPVDALEEVWTLLAAVLHLGNLDFF
ncbi:hypothetical protein T492DRAFT_873860 [Pavlovales sp. CCMP2436]|nr:hypothetical protein T492DRAFT_873860 [Pavlovales sp. CCMP2436]